MRHKIKKYKLNRTSSHRIAMLKNMARSLVLHEQMMTTCQKAKMLRPYIERLVTKARNGDTLSVRRYLVPILKDKALIDKLINVLGVRYKDRPGGYTRIVKAFYRHGDNARTAVIQFVRSDE